MESRWYELFLESLYKKYPQKSQLAEALMDLLSIEREAVYRRLRNDVIFPASEIIKIASSWNISLDNIIGLNKDKMTFQMQFMDYFDLSEKETQFLQEIIRHLDVLIASGNKLEYMEVSNKLPRSLTSGFLQLTRYYMFKWRYQYGSEGGVVPFSRIVLHPRLQQTMSHLHESMRNVANVNYLWDHMLFDYLVFDIQYFHSILLITDEEKELIKQELSNLLDYMEETANKGSFPGAHNKVNLCISRINLDTSYSYVFSESFKISRVHVFSKHEIYTTDPEIATAFKTWMNLKKRSSIQISEVDAKYRIEFFAKQRQLIDSL
jgi:hypothetical protein